MGLSPKSNYEKKIVSCFDIGEVPRSPGKWNWNWLYFLPFIFTFEQGGKGCKIISNPIYITGGKLCPPYRLVPGEFKNVPPGLFCYYSQVTVSSAVSITFESCLICLSKVTELEKKVILLKSAIFIVQAIWITKCTFLSTAAAYL